jgi:hypothetical protein
METMRVTVDHHHKFSPGQTVLFVPGAMDRNAPKGSYVVLLCLPDDGIGFQYSIKSTIDAHERVVREHRLTAA